MIFPSSEMFNLMEVDWQLLREQRRILAMVATGEPVTPEERELLFGIANLLEEMTYQAVKAGLSAEEEAYFTEDEDK